MDPLAGFTHFAFNNLAVVVIAGSVGEFVASAFVELVKGERVLIRPELFLGRKFLEVAGALGDAEPADFSDEAAVHEVLAPDNKGDNIDPREFLDRHAAALLPAIDKQAHPFAIDDGGDVRPFAEFARRRGR